MGLEPATPEYSLVRDLTTTPPSHSSGVGLFFPLVGLHHWQHDNLRRPADTDTEVRRRLYVLPHQRLWTFDVGLLVCPLSATERFLLQPSSVEQSSIARHCCPLSPSSAVVLNRISSHFLIPLSGSSLTSIQYSRSDSSFWIIVIL